VIVVPANANIAEDLTGDPGAWDATVRANGGHMLQSWRWGAFKERFGWRVARFAVEGDSGPALAQVLYRSKAGVTVGYVPRGPVVPEDDAEAMAKLWSRIDDWARRRRTLTIIVEPDGELPATPGRGAVLVPGPEPIQPSRTVKTRLCDDDGLMAQMHPKTRYNVRMAKRREVTCREAGHSDESVAVFYELLQDTAARNAFAVHNTDYYRAFLREFGQDALLLFAEIDGRVVAGVIAVVFGEEAIYMYGASSTKDRANGAGFLIQYEAMRWARDRGALRYDMWGIPEYDPESTVGESGDRLASSHGGDWRGIYEFKTRFGGDIVRYPRPMERQYHPVLASLARRFYSPGGAG
jgi:lipid II:glycine glycyltransferase (peptidoglycan interpeptide bridge formation enzyme)